MSKRILIIAIGLLLSLTVAEAQFIRGYGFKVGAVTANQKWDYSSFSDLQNDLSTNPRWGFTASFFVEFLDINTFSIVGELQYTQKGTHSTIGNITVDPRVDYLSIPVLLKARLSLPLIEPYVIVGPRYDILISKLSNGIGDVIDNFKTTDLGGTLGIGVDIKPILPIHLLAEFRYNACFQDAYDANSLKVKNSSYDLMVGIRF